METEPEERFTAEPEERETPLVAERTAPLPAEEERATPVRPVVERRAVVLPRVTPVAVPPGRRVTTEPPEAPALRVERVRLPVPRETPPRETRLRELRLASRWPRVPAWLGRVWKRPPQPPGP